MSYHVCVCMKCVPFRPTRRLHHWSHPVSVQALGLTEVHNVKDYPLKERRERVKLGQLNAFDLNMKKRNYICSDIR